MKIQFKSSEWETGEILANDERTKTLILFYFEVTLGDGVNTATVINGEFISLHVRRFSFCSSPSQLSHCRIRNSLNKGNGVKYQHFKGI